MSIWQGDNAPLNLQSTYRMNNKCDKLTEHHYVTEGERSFQRGTKKGKVFSLPSFLADAGLKVGCVQYVSRCVE